KFLVSIAWVIIYLVFTIALISYFYAKYDSSQSWSGIDSEGVILLTTGCILIFYTVETYFLRKEAEKQTSLTQRPYFRLKQKHPCDVSSATGKDATEYLPIEIVNIGAGAAKNIHFQVNKNGEKLLTKEPLLIRSIDCIEGSNGACQLRYDSSTVELVRDTYTAKVMSDQNGWKNYDLKNLFIDIEYADLENNKYQAKFSYSIDYSDCFKIIEQKKL
ncbi:hypothetical protein KKG46_05145, partial [Patescibacteria group bacterium]|nr:hypothetical protein [Patescibacteria group bacterium]